MNPYLVIAPVHEAEHNERLKRAERYRLIKEIRSNDGTAPSVRTRLGLIFLRTGARIMPEGEREIEFQQLLNRAG
jgi:hypothetical protein